MRHSYFDNVPKASNSVGNFVDMGMGSLPFLRSLERYMEPLQQLGHHSATFRLQPLANFGENLFLLVLGF